MKTQEEKIRALRESGKVRRAHVIPYNGEYNVGEHCFHIVITVSSSRKLLLQCGTSQPLSPHKPEARRPVGSAPNDVIASAEYRRCLGHDGILPKQ